MTDRQMVVKAAKRMDKIKPGWWRHIRLGSLNLNEPRNCICGQNGLCWTDVCQSVGVVPDDFFANATCQNSLKPLWWAEVKKRREARKAVPA